MNMKKSKKVAGDETTEKRREFLKKAGKFGITAPMAALLLSVGSKRASATKDNGYGNGTPHTDSVL